SRAPVRVGAGRQRPGPPGSILATVSGRHRQRILRVMSTTNDSTEPQRKRRFGRKNKPPRDPNNPGRWQQFKQVWVMTRKHDPAAMWWMLLAGLAVLLLGLLIGLWLDMVVYVMILSVPLAILAAVFVLARRAEQAAFSQIEGQPGATSA